MIVKTGDFFIYVAFESKTGDFRGNPNKRDKMKVGIPEQERHYISEDRMWVIDNNEHNKKVVEALGEN